MEDAAENTSSQILRRAYVSVVGRDEKISMSECGETQHLSVGISPGPQDHTIAGCEDFQETSFPKHVHSRSSPAAPIAQGHLSPPHRSAMDTFTLTSIKQNQSDFLRQRTDHSVDGRGQ